MSNNRGSDIPEILLTLFGEFLSVNINIKKFKIPHMPERLNELYQKV
jgi:hypothetical protein